MAFIVDVVTQAKVVTRRSDIMKLVIDAGERFLGTRQLPEELHRYMVEKQVEIHKAKANLKELRPEGNEGQRMEEGEDDDDTFVY